MKLTKRATENKNNNKFTTAVAAVAKAPLHQPNEENRKTTKA